jgi:hypothetical protein
MRTEEGQDGGKCSVLVWDRCDGFCFIFNLATILEGTFFHFRLL